MTESLKPTPYRANGRHFVRLGAARLAGPFDSQEAAESWIAGAAFSEGERQRLGLGDSLLVAALWIAIAIVAGAAVWAFLANLPAVAAGLVLTALFAFLIGA